MKKCLDCKYDILDVEGQRMEQCRQGHSRTFKRMIENCHAWEERSKCWCSKELHDKTSKLRFINEYGYSEYLGTPKFCPECGNKLRKED